MRSSWKVLQSFQYVTIQRQHGVVAGRHVSAKVSLLAAECRSRRRKSRGRADFLFRVPRDAAIKVLTGGPSGHPMRPLLRKQGVTMARPLTKTEPDGALYRRPAAVEAQVDDAVQLKLSDLRHRLLVTDRDDPAFLRSECLVHLLRHGRRTSDQALMSAALPVLLSRCEANLLVTVPDGRMPDATSLRRGDPR